MTSAATISDEEVFAAFPNVLIDQDNIEHYRGLAAGKFMINRCAACGHWIYPHRPLCPRCLSWDVAATEVSGKGRVFMVTLIQQERDPNDRRNEPLAAVAVELVEQKGLRYLATIANCPSHEITIDMPVRLTWIEQDGHKVPAFEPEPDARV